MKDDECANGMRTEMEEEERKSKKNKRKGRVTWK
jgi:hypothetical protein